MITPIIEKNFSSWSNQLSLNLNYSPAWTKTRIADRVHDITSNEITFHSKESEIGENNFALKISYMGRSYLFKWIYKKEEVRSFDQENFSTTAIRIIRFDSILAYRNGQYISAFLPQKNYNELIKAVPDMLSRHCKMNTIH